jgi:hypothetical protein
MMNMPVMITTGFLVVMWISSGLRARVVLVVYWLRVSTHFINGCVFSARKAWGQAWQTTPDASPSFVPIPLHSALVCVLRKQFNK